MESEDDQKICAICKDTTCECDFVTRCGHYFHEKCLADWLLKQIECPYCRSIISKSKLREKFIWGVRKAEFNKTVADELISFFERITEIDQQAVSYNNRRSKYEPYKYHPDIPLYGREMIENLIIAEWNINSKDGGCLNLLYNIREKDDIYRLNLLLDHGLNLLDENFKKVLDEIMLKIKLSVPGIRSFFTNINSLVVVTIF